MQFNPLFKKKIFIVRYSAILTLKLICLDQITKWWFFGFLKQSPGLKYKVTSFFDLVAVWNYGISFGLFKNYYQYSNIFFCISNSLIALYILYLLLKSSTFLSFIGYNLIAGGAIGNILDRIFKGAVFDFIYFHYQEYGLFIFNLADSFISIGAAFIAYDLYRTKKNIEARIRSQYDELETEAEAEKIRKASDKNFENLER